MKHCDATTHLSEWPQPTRLTPTCCGGCGATGTLSLLTEAQNGAGNRETAQQFHTKPNTFLPYNPAIMLLGIYPEELKTRTKTCTQMFTAASSILGSNQNVLQWVRGQTFPPPLMFWRRKWQSTPVLLPRKSHGRRRPVQATVHGIAKSRARLSDFTFFHFSGRGKGTFFFFF